MIQRHIAETMNLAGFDFFNDAKDTAQWLRGLKSTIYDRLANEIDAGREKDWRTRTNAPLTENSPVMIKNTHELVTNFDHKPGIVLKQWSGHPEFYTVVVKGTTAVFHESQLHQRL